MGRRLRGAKPWPLDIDLAFDPAEPRDGKGRWTFIHLITRSGAGYEAHTVAALDTAGKVRAVATWGGMNTTHSVNALWTDPEFRRQGLATEVLRRARGLAPGLAHSAERSNLGDAFAKQTKLAPPKRRKVESPEDAEQMGKSAAIIAQSQYDAQMLGKESMFVPAEITDVTDPKYRALDLANPATRPTVVVATRRTEVTEDSVVRSIANLLRTGYRFNRLAGDFGQEVEGIAKLLSPWGIREEAVRMALGLTHTEGGSRRGTAHSPNARLAGTGATLTDSVREVRDHDVYFRAAYIANAALRMQATLDDGGTQRAALTRERTYYQMHEQARRGRLQSAAQVQGAANLYGEPSPDGTLVGWYLNPLKNNEAECIAASGHNFYAEHGTVIGLPGSVHNQCGCYAGPPWEGAAMVDDVMRNVRVLHPTGSTAKFRLKEKGA